MGFRRVWVSGQPGPRVGVTSAFCQEAGSAERPRANVSVVPHFLSMEAPFMVKKASVLAG